MKEIIDKIDEATGIITNLASPITTTPRNAGHEQWTNQRQNNAIYQIDKQLRDAWADNEHTQDAKQEETRMTNKRNIIKHSMHLRANVGYDSNRLKTNEDIRNKCWKRQHADDRMQQQRVP